VNPLAIQGVGVLGGFGCGVAELERRLALGPAAPGELSVPFEGEEIRLPAQLADPTALERFVSKRATRRTDHFSRMALLGAHLALEDAGALECPRGRMGVVIATGYGPTRTTFSFLDTVLDDGDACASPTHFSNSVHNAPGAHVAIQLKATGPSLTVSQFEMSVASALLTAQSWLAEGRVGSVLFGAVDEACAVLGYCWKRYFSSSRSLQIAPFALDRQSAVPGEGAAFFLLDRAREARYGHISRVSLGRAGKGTFSSGPFVLNADGHPACSAPYRGLLSGPAKVAAYTPHFGSLPVGQAFDLAVAALAVRDGRFPPAPASESLPEPWSPAAGAETDAAVTCLKCDAGGHFGAISVERL
jgi:3-oxoacyl-[acyl-carrier-protein] synthase II